jgi:putative transcriptional regulator
VKKKTLGQTLIQGMTEALEYTQGKDNGARVHIPEHIDVQQIRMRLDLTQESFAARYGFALKTVKNWEQGVREPTGPARILLMLLDNDPKTIEKMIQAYSESHREAS